MLYGDGQYTMSEEFVIALIVVSIISLMINLLITNYLVHQDKRMSDFVKASDKYIEAFGNVTDTVNTNAKIYTLFGKQLHDHTEVLQKMQNILEIHAYALRLTPPDFKESSESEN
jgi:uncharacterized membrane protein